MRRAIRLAKKGSGWVNPNPMVGAVLVRDGQITGEGYHHYFGSPHAEVETFNHASGTVAGATLVVNLEPCIHEGKTPACAPLILEKGIKRVVVGMEDPNPLVKGEGINFLRKNGIRVDVGILEKECIELNEVFTKYISTGLPFVILKSAMTMDGKIATVTNSSRWITGEASRKRVHKMRQQYTAIMAGAGTILNDDPLLNTRQGREGSRDPIKVIADSRGRIPLTARIFLNNPQLTILAVTDQADSQKLRDIERLGVQIVICPRKENRVDLAYLMKALGRMGIDAVMIEGGGTLAFSALKDGIVDKVVCFIAPKILGGDKAPTSVGGTGVEKLEDAFVLKNMRVKKVGADLMMESWISNY